MTFIWYIRYGKINHIDDPRDMTRAEEYLTSKPAATRDVSFASKKHQNTERGRSHEICLLMGEHCTGEEPKMGTVIIVSYYPNPASCRVNNKVFIPWKNIAKLLLLPRNVVSRSFYGPGRGNTYRGNGYKSRTFLILSV